jgi:BMFP domain-containing protein YqiC
MGYEITKKEDEDSEMSLSPAMEQKIDKIFDTLIEVNEKDIIVRENCKLCKSSLRFEAEQKWEELSFNYTKTLEWLNDEIDQLNMYATDESEKRAKFTLANVKNHMKNHYAEQERQIRLKEYAKNIESLVQVKQHKTHMLEACIAMCYENLGRIASTDVGNDIKEQKIRSEAINKVMSTMMSVIDLQNKIEGEISTAEAMQNKFTHLWIDIINREESDVKKKILIEMLEDFSTGFGG